MSEIKKKSGKFSSFDGTKIYYECRGEGEPIVFVYGIACLMNHWHFQVDYFSKNYQVITFDIRGHHLSDVAEDKANFTISAVAQDISALLTHLQISKAHLVGHSFGVPVVLDFYRQFSEQVRSLTLINGFARNPIQGMFGLDVIEPFYWFVRNQYKQSPSLWNSLWKLSIHNPLAMWLSGALGGFNLRLTPFKDIEIYAKGVSELSLDSFMRLFEDMMKFEGGQILPTINVPALIIAGDKDSITPMSFQEELHREIKDSSYTIIPYGSHCSQLDFPDYVNLKIDEHLKKQKPAD